MNKIIYKAFLDTNFFINLLNPYNTFHNNAKEYFEVLLKNGVSLYTSSITISEYCVKGRPSELPLKNLKIMSFDIRDGVETGKTANLVLERKNDLHLEKKYIPDDVKLLTQAENIGVDFFISADKGCRTIHNYLSKQNLLFYYFF